MPIRIKVHEVKFVHNVYFNVDHRVDVGDSDPCSLPEPSDLTRPLSIVSTESTMKKEEALTETLQDAEYKRFISGSRFGLGKVSST